MASWSDVTWACARGLRSAISAPPSPSRLGDVEVSVGALSGAHVHLADAGPRVANLNPAACASHNVAAGHFTRSGSGPRRHPRTLREMVVYARQHLISDPPFSRMDLISSRNLLISLAPALSRRALPTFHYALNPGGFLMLGASESIGPFTERFESVDQKHKIYMKKRAQTPARHRRFEHEGENARRVQGGE